MILQNVKIQNFKILREADVDFKPGMNLLIGINGAGKSTFLQALHILVSWLIARIASKNGKGCFITNDSITSCMPDCKLEITMDNGVSWSLYKQRSTVRVETKSKSDLSQLNDFVRNYYENNSNEDLQLKHVPLFAFYSVDRAVTEVPKYVHHIHHLLPVDIYSKFDDEKINFRDFFEWFREKEDIENENYRQLSSGRFRPDRQLKAVREALSIALPQYSNLRIQRSPRAIMVDKDGDSFEFDQLSDGEKCYITLIGDIARKIAMANPDMEQPLDAPGVVIIDEIDLHLHPSWQQTIISNLTKAFRNVQFIVTTHSPFVVSSTEPSVNNQVLTLTDGNIEPSTADDYGAEVQNVLLNTFRLDTLRNNEVQGHIDHLWRIISSMDYDEAEADNEITWLRNHLSENDKEFLKIKLQMALIKKKEAGHDAHK